MMSLDVLEIEVKNLFFKNNDAETVGTIRMLLQGIIVTIQMLLNY